MNSQDIMPSPEASQPIAIGPQKSNSTKAQDKDFKTAVVNMHKDFNEHLSNALMKAMKTQAVE